MIIGDYGALSQAVNASDAVKAQLDKLTQQVSDGLVSDSYAGLGTAAQTSLDLQPQVNALQAQQTAIGAVTGQMGVTQTALSQINTIATNFNAQLATLTNVSPSEIDTTALAAKTALQQIANLLDTNDGGVYVFGGTDSKTAPVPNPDSITSSGFYTQIATAVAGLGSNGAAATLASTLSIASSNAAGTTPFAGPPGQAPTADLGTGAPVQTSVLANANTMAVSGGTSTTGSYMRDILRSLATVANLSSSQANDAGFSTLVSDTQTAMNGAISAMGVETGALGNIQSSLTSAQTEQSDTQTSLTSQVSGVQDVDMAATISKLTEVQTQLSASYKLISEVSTMSLVSYLPTS